MPDIRKVGIESIPVIRQLIYSVWPVAYKNILQADQIDYMLKLLYSEASLKNQIENLHHQFIIVYENNIAIGLTSYSPKHPGNFSIYRLHKLYVETREQGKALGKLLLNYVLEEAKANGATMIELNVNRYNEALGFYKKAGFDISRKEDLDIGSGYFMNDYVMKKPLL